MALRSEIINFIRTHFGNDLVEAEGVAKVSIMKMEMRLAFEMGNTFAEIHRRTTDDAMDIIALFEEEFGKVAAVLSRNTGDKSGFIHNNVDIQQYLLVEVFGNEDTLFEVQEMGVVVLINIIPFQTFLLIFCETFPSLALFV